MRERVGLARDLEQYVGKYFSHKYIRTKILKQMSEIVINDAPWIFLYQPLSFGLSHSWVENYEYHAFPYGMGKYRKINDSVKSNWKK